MLTQNPVGIKFEESGLSVNQPVKFHKKVFYEDSVIRMHYHSSFEINLYKDVKGVLVVEGYKFPLNDYSMVFFNPNVLHSYNIEGNGGEVRVWHIGLNHFYLLDSLNMNRYLKREHQQIIMKRKHNKSMENLLDQLTAGDELHQASCLLKLFDKIYGGSNTQPIKYQTDPFLRKIISYSEEHFSSGISLDKAAEVVHLSRYHFCRKFKARTGSTFNEYLNNLKMENSIHCLNMGMSVSQASGESGFEDISYFIKRFKRSYGVTPGEYSI